MWYARHATQKFLTDYLTEAIIFWDFGRRVRQCTQNYKTDDSRLNGRQLNHQTSKSALHEQIKSERENFLCAHLPVHRKGKSLTLVGRTLPTL